MERYCKLGKVDRVSLKNAKTPPIDDHQLKPEDLEDEGQFSKNAARVVMKILYGARLVRYVFLWAVNSLAREASRWTRACDKRLCKPICYLNLTNDLSLEGFCGDPPEHCHVM